MTTTEFDLRRVGKWVLLTCPQCGLTAQVDDDQFHGKVSVDCPTESCDFHETHDFSKMPIHEA